ncbi:uncharacterized protein [Venturia canescens]|uniref:uncharacterized protein n=1 Tax=Venturia canescens TaxID=32260 RepID=UPI001C9D54F9|nr:uncharacterized protein LOC122416635 [Venturia canescens]
MKACWGITIFLAVLTCNVIARNTDNLSYDREYRRGTGSMLAEIAKELVQRSTSSSQVLNLNLSNLLLLLVLKAVVFGASYIGNQENRGRELNEENVVSEGEVALALGYMIGDTCLYRAACEVPNTAKEYLGAVEMIVQTMKLIPQYAQLDKSYEKTLTDFKKAIDHGTNNQCPPEYTCKKESIRNFLRPEREILSDEI